jgi:transcriptional regulator NrdR family protein
METVMSTTVICPKCQSNGSRTIDSRYIRKSGYNTVRRRKECLNCKFRFTTYEVHMEVFDYIDTVIKYLDMKMELQRLAKQLNETRTA